MVGVAADGNETGKVLWETDEWNHTVAAPSPIILGGGRILVTAGYGVGSAIFRLRREGGEFSVSREQTFDRKAFACEQQTPILYRDHLFTVMPKDSGTLRNQMVCMNAGGERSYSSGRDHRFGLGPFLIADDKLFILNDDGLLTMARASTTGYEQLAQARVLEGRDAWAPMALAGGLLILRDSTRMVCLDLRAPSAGAEGPPARGGDSS
jgi:outer membrane protein assembly factor BamB